MFIRNKKKVVWSRPARRTKSLSRIALVTAGGQRVLSEKNCTRPAGDLPICCKKSCKRSVPTGSSVASLPGAPGLNSKRCLDSARHDKREGERRDQVSVFLAFADFLHCALS